MWRDDSTAFVLVTAPRVDTVDETLWFDERLADHGVSTAGIIVNRMTPSPPISVPSGFDDDLVEWSKWMTQLATAEADAVGPLAERADALGAPLMLVRRLGADVHDATGLSVLAGYLVTTS